MINYMLQIYSYFLRIDFFSVENMNYCGDLLILYRNIIDNEINLIFLLWLIWFILLKYAILQTVSCRNPKLEGVLQLCINLKM